MRVATIIKYLKRFTGIILLIIVLLIIQALTDLALPQYTSDIVDIGIQQNGIKEIAPKVIRESELNKLILFMDDEDKNYVDDNYTLIVKENLPEIDYEKYLKVYPELKNTPLYKENLINDRESQERLDEIFTKPITIVENIENNREMSEGLEKVIVENMPEGMVGDNMNVFQLLGILPKDVRDNIVEKINGNFNNMPQTLLSQAGISYVKNEYKAVGIDTDKEQINYIFNSGIKMIGLALIGGISIVLVSFFASRVAASLAKILRKDVFEKVLSFSNVEFDKFSTASLITRTTNDIVQIQTFVVMMLRMIFYAPILGCGGIIKVLGTNKSMTWIIAVAVGTILIVISILFGLAMPRFKRIQTLIDKVNQIAREILTGLPVIRAFTTEKHEENRFDDANKDLTKTNLFVSRIMTCMMPSMMLIMNAISVLIVWIGAGQINDGNMQVGDLMAFIQYTMQIVMSFLMISMVSMILPRALVSAKRIEEVLKTELSIIDPSSSQNINVSKKGYVEYQNVYFKYPDGEEVLSDISFTAKPGKVTAIIGSTGSGKSTLVNLLPRFFDVTSGKILIDGVDVRNLTQHELREKIGFVPQKGVLFSGTIKSNIKYGKKNAKDSEMKRAAKIAQASQFIESKDEAYDTEISQGGTNVSGGQKQRISIARAVIKNPEILVFDDSFSALDYKTDVALRRALREETKNTTKILVAQRISTVLDAYEILVLDKGKIVGRGTHKDLMENCDTYRQIAFSQLSKEELANE
ncbi:ABC transporter ATP-binding protein [Clostridium butyricum]|uniref:ABC transporter, ATP-binding/permease protein n=1 Tax=Clostridium butyricum E4 str. BoNT E BL5262 TaxID=632245 RepID=C4IIW5_CLOBU|nr:ABC transporter ATP-binding protein [Clostridium butyricum]EDT76781.1 ABC transporter, ATP-binding/permease protein [Clostridium butyricum 5521]EEP55061.1 ABC transporter, ATP-binding/permease protein [Clostridium butyricum E4 str. BoNT E BL5262]EMU54323.1 ABC transporter, ATP-binding/permease protein [Clostridium butyricum DKU-01]NFL31439.1 ABC transporter ATP-binding protein [Clostridium butyricum]NFS17182.1 ABC transporter ATP-binding protein [Clostridium butyricum]